MLVRTRVIVRGAPGIVVTFWKFSAQALWNCTNGFLLETNFHRHLVWFNSWQSGSYEGRNWETSGFGFQPQRGADYFLTILRIPGACWTFLNALEVLLCLQWHSWAGAPPTAAAAFGQKAKHKGLGSLKFSEPGVSQHTQDFIKGHVSCWRSKESFHTGKKWKIMTFVSLYKPALCRLNCQTQLGNPNSDILSKKLCVLHVPH